MKNIIFAGLLVIASGAVVFANDQAAPANPQVGANTGDNGGPGSGTTAHGGGGTSDVGPAKPDTSQPGPQDKSAGLLLVSFDGGVHGISDTPNDDSSSAGSNDNDAIHTGDIGADSTGQDDGDNDTNAMQEFSFNA